jgi:hypothetical protein
MSDKNQENEYVNFLLWNIFLLLVGSGFICMYFKQKFSLWLIVAGFLFWFSVATVSRKSKTIKKDERLK